MSSRTTIIRGPALVQFKGATFFSKADIAVKFFLDSFPIETSAFGKTDERVKERRAEVSFVPDGEWRSLAVLFPYATAKIGDSMFGVDAPLTIVDLAGKTYAFKAGAVTQMPGIVLSATQTLLEQVTFTCIGADGSNFSDVDSFLVISAGAAPSLAAFDASKIYTQCYSMAWGAIAPWDSFKSLDRTKIGFNLGSKPLETDCDGIVDYTFQNLEVTATLKPFGPTEADILASLKIQGVGASRGRSLSAGAANLVATGTGVSVTLNKANIKSAGYEYGAATARNGDLVFVASRQVTGGVLDPLFTVA